MTRFGVVALLLVLASCFGMRQGPGDLPTDFRREAPETGTFVFEGQEIHVWSQHRIDSMGPDAHGYYEFHYDYVVFDFSLGSTKLLAKAYTDPPHEAHLIRIEEAGTDRFLEPGDLTTVLVRSALQYFRDQGRTDLTWLDQANQLDGYSPVP